MKIIIKLPSSKSMSVECQPTDNIFNVKTKIQNHLGVLLQKQTLIFNGSPLLDDSATLQSLLISQDDELFLFFQNKIIIYVKSIDKESLLMKLDSAATLKDLQIKIENEMQIKMENQLLLIKDNQVESTNECIKLQSMNIQDGDIIKAIDVNRFSVIRLYIKHVDKAKFAVDVYPTMTVRDFIQTHAVGMFLFYKNKLLTTNKQTLSDVGVEDEDILYAVPKSLDLEMIITINLNNVAYQFKADETKTLQWLSDELKNKLDKSEQQYQRVARKKDPFAYFPSFRFLLNDMEIPFNQYNRTFKELNILTSIVINAHRE